MTVCSKGVGFGLASLLAIASHSASAQNFGSFGDNIADPGNIPGELEEGNQQNGTNVDTNFPPSPPGFGNRFSNGLTAAELLPELLDFQLTDIQHNAVGNAFSGQLPVSLAGGIPLGNGSSIPGPIGRGLTALNDTDVASQVDRYLARVGSLGREDFMLLYASGNDAALALNTIALTGAPQSQALGIIVAGSQTNAANTAASAGRLLDAGAGTVLVSNLPDIGQTPAARAGGLSGVQLATLFSTTTNDALANALSQLDPGNGTLILADSFTLTNDIVANPGKYGFSDVTNPCSLVPSCVSAGRDVQDQFLFWDVFFPTARGHEISALFLADTVNAPRTIPALAEVSRFDTEQEVRGVLNLEGEGLWIAASGGYERFRRNRDTFAAGYEAEGPGGRIAIGFTALDSFTLGAAIAFSDLDVDYDFVSGGFDKRSVHLSAFASAQTPVIDLAAGLTYGFDDIENLARNTNVAGQVAVGETDGESFAVIAEASREFSFLPALSLRPAVRVGYSESDIDGFQEAGATGLSQIVGDLSLTKTFAEIGGTAGFDIASLKAQVSGFYHARLSGGMQRIQTALVSIPQFTRSARVAAGDRDYGRIEASLSREFGGVRLGVSGSMTLADERFDYLAGQAFIGFSF